MLRARGEGGNHFLVIGEVVKIFFMGGFRFQLVVENVAFLLVIIMYVCMTQYYGPTQSFKGIVPRDFLKYFFLHQSASSGHLIH